MEKWPTEQMFPFKPGNLWSKPTSKENGKAPKIIMRTKFLVVKERQFFETTSCRQCLDPAGGRVVPSGSFCHIFPRFIPVYTLLFILLCFVKCFLFWTFFHTEKETMLFFVFILLSKTCNSVSWGRDNILNYSLSAFGLLPELAPLLFWWLTLAPRSSCH